MPVALILSVGQEPMLLDTRSLILRAAGYLVESALSIKQAIHHLRTGDFDLVVLCHSIPSQERDRLVCLVRASGSTIPIVTVVPMSASEHHSEGLADATIAGDPRKLLLGIREALSKPKAHQPRMSEVAHSSADGKARRTILCIDDDPNLLMIRRRFLEGAGYDVLTAHNGSDGLKIFATGIADAAILDYAMPLMNGGAIAAQMRHINPAVPLILYSGYGTIPEENVALFNRYIPKGALPHLLLSALREVLPGADQTKSPTRTLEKGPTDPHSQRLQ
jgi:DNA-binding response OmpR family regulator